MWPGLKEVAWPARTGRVSQIPLADPASHGRRGAARRPPAERRAARRVRGRARGARAGDQGRARARRAAARARIVSHLFLVPVADPQLLVAAGAPLESCEPFQASHEVVIYSFA